MNSLYNKKLNNESFFNNFNDIPPDVFIRYSKFLSSTAILFILERIDNIKKYYKIDKMKFICVFKLCNDTLKNKLIKDINVSYICSLVQSNLIPYTDIWKNDDIYIDLVENIETLYFRNLLQNTIVYLENKIFKKIIPDVPYYILSDIYKSIKNDDNKLKIFINGIKILYISLLLNKMDDNMIEFINNNLNYTIRLELLSDIFTMNDYELSFIILSKLQIILLLNTSYEKIIIDHILNYEPDFSKKIINNLNGNNIYNLLKKVDINKKIFILTDINKKLILTLCDVIEQKLDNIYMNIENNNYSSYIEDIYLIKIIYIFIYPKISLY